MDVPLYAIGLAVFAVLYLALSVFLVWAILITLIVMFLFLTLRYGNVAEDYPHSAADVSITAIFVGITWGIFVFVGPKNPTVPLIGDGFTYADVLSSTSNTIGPVLVVTILLLIGFLVVFSFAAEKLAEARGIGGASTDEGGGKPKQGVGA